MSSLHDSLFISEQVHEREVELPDGNKHTLYFRELPAADFRKFHLAEQSDDENLRANSMIRLVAASLCEPDGKRALTVERAAKLKPQALGAIFAKVLEVNGFGGAAKKG
jgi:hypothetical protein